MGCSSKYNATKISKSVKQLWKSDKYRQKQSKSHIMAWKNSITRKNMQEAIKEGTNTKKFRRLRSRIQTTLWNDKDSVFNSQDFLEKRAATILSSSRIGAGKCGFRHDLGHFVRSSWEANICKILRYCRIYYEYEPKTFQLKNGSYTPDIFLSERNFYIEVKGIWLKDSFSKFKNFLIEYPQIQIGVIDIEVYSQLRKQYSYLLDWEKDGL